jgi:hypothetical protein
MNFQRNLLWRLKRDSFRQHPETYRAPSWSWASINCDIIPYEEFAFWAWNKNEIELASILDVRVEPLLSHTAALTGQVASGYIDIQCHVRPCYLRKNRSSGTSASGDTSQSDAIIITAGSWRASGEKIPTREDKCRVNPAVIMRQFSEYCTLDCPEEIPPTQWIEAYCVPLQIASMETDRYERAVWESYEGLVLLPVGEHDTVTRLREADIEQKCEELTLTARRPEVDNIGETISSSPLRTFRRIGIFAYHMNNDNREARQDELFGPKINHKKKTESRKKSIIRIV